MANIDTREFEAMLKKMTDALHESHAAFKNVHLRDIRSAFKKAVDGNIDATNVLSQSMKRAARSLDTESKYMRSELSGINEAFEEYNRGINRVSNGFSKLDTATKGTIRQQAALTSSLIEGIDFSNKAQDQLLNSIYGNVKSFELISSHANGVISSAWELEQAQSSLAKDVGMFERAIKNSKVGLDKEIKALLIKEKLNEASLTQGERTMLQLARKYKLENEGIDSYKKLINSSRAEITALQALITKQQMLAKAMDFAHDKFGALGKLFTGALSPLGMIVEGLTLFASGLKGSWEQMKLIADSGMIHQFQQIKKAQFELGISFENATKIFTENARSIAAIGGHRFSAALEIGSKNLEKFGLAPEAAAEAISDFTKNAVKSGINIRDQNKLNRAIQNQTQAFAKLRATTGTNMAEFKAMNDEMTNSTSVQEQLNGVSETERMNKINDMMKLRQTFVNMGMSAQTAQKALLSIQDIGKQKIVDRFDQAAKLQQAASIAGISNAKQLADIYRKGKRASSQEQAILQQGVGQMGQVFDQMSMQSFEAENIANVLTENLQGPLASMTEAGREQTLGASAVGKMSDNMANALTEFSKVPEIMAKGLLAEGQIKQLFTDPMVRSIAGLGVAMTGIATFLLGGISRLFTKNYSHIKEVVTATNKNVSVDQEISNTVKSIASGSGSSSNSNTGSTATRKNRKIKGSPNKNRGIKSTVVATKAGKAGILSTGLGIVEDLAGLANEGTPLVQAIVKGSGFFSKLKGAGSLILGFAKSFLGPITIFTSLISGAMAAFEAEDFLGMTEDETASIGQRIIVGISGAIKSLLFFLPDSMLDKIDEFTKYAASNIPIAKATIQNSFTLIGGIFEKLWINIKTLGSKIVAVGTALADFLLGSLQFLWNGIFSPSKMVESAKKIFHSFDAVNDTEREGDAQKAKIDADNQKIMDDRMKAAQNEVDNSKKAKVEARNANDEIKSNEQSIVKSTKEATESAIDTSKIFANATSVSAAGLRNELNSAIQTPGIGKIINSGLLNNNEAANDSNSSVNSTSSTVKLSDETMKSLADLLTTLNNTETVALEIEKEQLVLLEALVKSNSSALKLATESFAKEGMENVFTRNSKLSVMGKF